MFIDSQDNEMLISHSHSTLSVLPRSNAVRILYDCAAGGDGGVWRNCLSLLGREETGPGNSLYIIGTAVSAVLQDCLGKDSVECH